MRQGDDEIRSHSLGPVNGLTDLGFVSPVDLRELAVNLQVSAVSEIDEGNSYPFHRHNQRKAPQIIFGGFRATGVLHQAFLFHLGISSQRPFYSQLSFIENMIVRREKKVNSARSDIILIAIRRRKARITRVGLAGKGELHIGYREI